VGRIQTVRRRLGQLQPRLLIPLIIGATVSGLAFLAPPAASASPGSNVLGPGETLFPGQYLISATSSTKLIMQKDGNLVLYKYYPNGGVEVCGSSDTTAYPGAQAHMNVGGNHSFAVYNTQGNVVWTTSPHTDSWGYDVRLLTNTGGGEVENANHTRDFVFWPC
jgi:hypothetical protein